MRFLDTSKKDEKAHEKRDSSSEDIKFKLCSLRNNKRYITLTLRRVVLEREESEKKNVSHGGGDWYR